MEKLLQSKLPEVVKLLHFHKVKRAYAFGSVVNGGFQPTSDIDLLVAFEDNLDPVEYGEHYFELVNKLEILFNRSVDLVTELSLKNPYFIKVLNETKVVLYE